MTARPDDFVLAVDKPSGPTSHDVVARARRALGIRRIGHTGTLDPFASGLMLLCVGQATRLAEYLTGMAKSYEATARLGIETDTLDLEGRPVSSVDEIGDVDTESIESALAAQVGPLDQVPPQYSAKKVDGEAMYHRARRGESVDLPPVRVHVHEARLIGYAPPDVRFRVRCSSGTYIRAMARDLGRALGVGAHLTALRRTAVGAVGVEAALPLEALDDEDAVTSARIEPLEALSHLRAVGLDEEGARRLRHGQRIRIADPVTADSGVDIPSERVAVHLDGRELVAIADLVDGVIRPRKVFAS